MKRKIITTGDGSKTIHIEDWNEQYHSIHGAINEANHVYLKHGLLYFFEHLNEKAEDALVQNESSSSKEISILEIGFGTGLNAFLTLIEAEKRNLNITYTGVEAFPVEKKEIEMLNYSESISKTHRVEFEKMHASRWEENVSISQHFKLKKEKKFFKNIEAVLEFDIVYFDAFGPRVQPELWTEAIFKIIYRSMKPNSVLTTYSAKGSARRAMQIVGFEVERLEGPPNKRHMLRTIKR